MTPLVLVLVVVCGGVGAAIRFTVDQLIRSRQKTGFQWATTIINAAGSLALGFLTGLTMVHLLPTNLAVIIGAAHLAGFTTFSTASYETVQLVRKKKYGFAFLSSVGMLVICVGLACLGLWIGASI